jgi:glycosyltransferase involved in cell wall biosynthesis
VRVSIVIPAYNRADLVPETLAAVLGQMRGADEVIVVDDGSRDSTPEVLAGHAPRVRAIRIGNSGDLAARNVGLRHAEIRYGAAGLLGRDAVAGAGCRGVRRVHGRSSDRLPALLRFLRHGRADLVPGRRRLGRGG